MPNMKRGTWTVQPTPDGKRWLVVDWRGHPLGYALGGYEYTDRAEAVRVAERKSGRS